ncbi:hypothetical protein PDESU_02295 [Pontiella desulfatans]|uniref:Lipoprotein n=1 Tax=Pontiella desulfatans TaxID=2750659 RepID=A0A6C2U187_PONDE|nr:hypothetical protein [Pontiella desulfatans]VGO13738.1 hypothetical protein PDESU_02295 [Pontiella desulfatans]
MKVLAKFFVFVTIATVIAGCASDTAYIPRIPPEAQAKLLDYFEKPDNKVFIIAIDPGGDFAYAYDYGKSTLKEAARVAVKKCDESRNDNGIIARPYIYAMNNEVVYEKMIRSAQKSGNVEQEREAQKQELEQVDEAENPEAVKELEAEDASAAEPVEEM